MELTGRNIVVTGAGRGIGESLAREFHARGANIVVAEPAADPQRWLGGMGKLQRRTIGA